jgi:hypothetical protein
MKRELETHFVHRFSNATMPAFNIFKNSFHYWILGGGAIAYFLYHPKYTSMYSDTFVNICAILFMLAEFGNLYCHIILRNLRAPGTREKGIPRGFLFELTTCANYTCEVFAWLFFAIFVHTLSGNNNINFILFCYICGLYNLVDLFNLILIFFLFLFLLFSLFFFNCFHRSNCKLVY